MDLALQVHPSKPDSKQAFDWKSTAGLDSSFTLAFAMVSARIDFKVLSSVEMFVLVLGILAFVAFRAYQVTKVP